MIDELLCSPSGRRIRSPSSGPRSCAKAAVWIARTAARRVLALLLSAEALEQRGGKAIVERGVEDHAFARPGNRRQHGVRRPLIEPVGVARSSTP